MSFPEALQKITAAIDMIICKSRAFSQEEFARRRQLNLQGIGSGTVWLTRVRPFAREILRCA
jgi:hypothetical protein